MAMRDTPLYLFLSHSWHDKDFIRKLDQSLQLHGVPTFLDERDINIGDSIPRKISEEIGRSTHLVYVISAHSISSPWVNEELDIAHVMAKEKNGYKIFPLLTEDVALPPSIRHLRYGDFRNWQVLDSYYRSLRDLLKSLGYHSKAQSTREIGLIVAHRHEIRSALQEALQAAELMTISLDIGYGAPSTRSEDSMIAKVFALKCCLTTLRASDYPHWIVSLTKALAVPKNREADSRIESLVGMCSTTAKLFREVTQLTNKFSFTTPSYDDFEDAYRSAFWPFLDGNRHIFKSLNSIQAEIEELMVAGISIAFSETADAERGGG